MSAFLYQSDFVSFVMYVNVFKHFLRIVPLTTISIVKIKMFSEVYQIYRSYNNTESMGIYTQAVHNRPSSALPLWLVEFWSLIAPTS